ncbi:MAG: tetratricopeptide repeat protein [Betaproteobacteria bacterium]
MRPAPWKPAPGELHTGSNERPGEVASTGRGDAAERLKEGCDLLRDGRLDEAQAALEAAISLDPENAEAQNKLGVILARKGRLDEAEIRFERALALNPRYAAAMSNLGNIYKEKNMLDRAIECYNMALSIDPDHATAHHNLGVVYRQMGMIDRAVGHFKQAHRLQLRALGKEGRTGSTSGRYLWLLVAVVFILVYVLGFRK